MAEICRLTPVEPRGMRPPIRRMTSRRGCRRIRTPSLAPCDWGRCGLPRRTFPVSVKGASVQDPSRTHQAAYMGKVNDSGTAKRTAQPRHPASAGSQE